MRRSTLVACTTVLLLGALGARQLSQHGPLLPRASGEEGEAPVASTGFALLELFTSEGCSSCPPADEVLADALDEARGAKLPVVGLAWHVDYWNHLGWPDPWGARLYTLRQLEYASAFGDPERVYTPQLVVNGRTAVAGSDRSALSSAVRDALVQPAAVAIELTSRVNDRRATIWARVRGAAPRDALLVVVVAEDGLSSMITSGENSGRVLHHVAVVRAARVERLEGQEAVTFDLPLPSMPDVVRSRASTVAFVQAQRGGPVLGLTKIALSIH